MNYPKSSNAEGWRFEHMSKSFQVWKKPRMYFNLIRKVQEVLRPDFEESSTVGNILPWGGKKLWNYSSKISRFRDICQWVSRNFYFLIIYAITEYMALNVAFLVQCACLLRLQFLGFTIFGGLLCSSVQNTMRIDIRSNLEMSASRTSCSFSVTMKPICLTDLKQRIYVCFSFSAFWKAYCLIESNTWDASGLQTKFKINFSSCKVFISA